MSNYWMSLPLLERPLGPVYVDPLPPIPIREGRRAWKSPRYRWYKKQTTPRYPKVKPHNWRAEVAAAKAAHARLCRNRPQMFRLTEDGRHAAKAIRAHYSTDEAGRIALAEARYLDWLDSRDAVDLAA